MPKKKGENMKYIAIFDDEDLSNFRVDVRSNGEFSDKVLVLTDEASFTRGFELKPLQEAIVVSEEGNSAYLSQEDLNKLRADFYYKLNMRHIKHLMNKLTDEIVEGYKTEGQKDEKAIAAILDKCESMIPDEYKVKSEDKNE